MICLIVEAIVAAIHAMPPDLLDTLGTISDVISDMSPAILRPFLHVVFTMLLN